MLWLTLSLLTALSVASRDLLVKMTAQKVKAMEIALLELFWSLPFFAIALIFIDTPPLDNKFWWAYWLSLPLNWAAYLLYITAIALAPLSTTVPLLSFTPIFMLLTGALFLSEHVGIIGTLGIFFIVCGTYMLHFEKRDKGVMKPFMAIITEKSSLMMLSVSFIFSFAAVIGKIGMQHSSPLFFGFFFFLTCNIAMLICFAAMGKFSWKLIRKRYLTGISLGALFCGHILLHCLAIVETKAVYMISIKRSSILFSVLFAWLFLRESQIKMRWMASLLMFVGATIITIWG